MSKLENILKIVKPAGLFIYFFFLTGNFDEYVLKIKYVSIHTSS